MTSMNHFTSLCVSVLAGEDLLSGPDWLKVEKAKTLIDVLVQVSGTRALGQQVQVIVSKEPSFTEAALVQVLNPVSLLHESGSIYVKYLLRSSVLSLKQSVDIKCKAERDTDISPFDFLQREHPIEKYTTDAPSLVSPNSALSRPFESNYLNQLFNEQKLSPSMASIKQELTKIRTDNEHHLYTTWQQQSQVKPTNDMIPGNETLVSFSIDGLTKWTHSEAMSMNGNVLAKSPANGAKEGLERSAEEVDENGSPEQKENCRSGCLDEVGEIGKTQLSPEELKKQICSEGDSPTDSSIEEPKSSKCDEAATKRLGPSQVKKPLAKTKTTSNVVEKKDAKSGMPSLRRKPPRPLTGKLTGTLKTRKEETNVKAPIDKSVKPSSVSRNTNITRKNSSTERKTQSDSTPVVKKLVSTCSLLKNAKKCLPGNVKKPVASCTVKKPVLCSIEKKPVLCAIDKKPVLPCAEKKPVLPCTLKKPVLPCSIEKQQELSLIGKNARTKLENKANQISKAKDKDAVARVSYPKLNPKQGNSKPTAHSEHIEAQSKITKLGLNVKNQKKTAITEEKENNFEAGDDASLQEDYGYDVSYADSIEMFSDSVNLVADSVNLDANSVNLDADSVDLDADSVNLVADSLDLVRHCGKGLITAVVCADKTGVFVEGDGSGGKNGEPVINRILEDRDDFAEMLDMFSETVSVLEIDGDLNQGKDGVIARPSADENHRSTSKSSSNDARNHAVIDAVARTQHLESATAVYNTTVGSNSESSETVLGNNDEPYVWPSSIEPKLDFEPEATVNRSLKRSPVSSPCNDASVCTGKDARNVSSSDAVKMHGLSGRELGIEEEERTAVVAASGGNPGNASIRYSSPFFQSLLEDSLSGNLKGGHEFPKEPCDLSKSRNGESESLTDTLLDSSARKSGFFDHLKEITIENVELSPENSTLENDGLDSVVDEADENSGQSSKLDSLLHHDATEKQRNMLNVTIDEELLGEELAKLCQEAVRECRNLEENVVLLSDTSRDSSANRTFTFDDEDEEGETVIYSSGKASNSEMQEAGLKDDMNEIAQSDIATAGENKMIEAAVDQQKLSKENSSGLNCQNNFGKDVECHVRREWSNKFGIMDQLLLTSLFDLSSELNVVAERILKQTKNNKLTESKVLGADKSSASLPGKSEVNQECTQLFRNLRRLENHLIRIEESIESRDS